MPYDAHVITNKLQNNISIIGFYSLIPKQYSQFVKGMEVQIEEYMEKIR